MEDQLPPLLGLEAFEAAARHENFVLAAHELAVSQSTVSSRVRNLESHLGQVLFHRLPRGVRLTDAGRAYLPAVRSAFEQVAGSTAGLFGRSRAPTLQVRAPVSFAALWLPPVMSEFQSRFPHIEVTITSSVWIDGRGADNIDVDLRLGRGGWSGVDASRLFGDPLVVVAAPKVARRLRSAPDLVALLHHPIVHLMSSDDEWRRVLADLGLKRADDTRDMRVDSAVAAFGIAAGSDHLALGQRCLAAPLIRAGIVATVLDWEHTTEEALYVTTPRRDARPKPEAVLFRDWLLDEFGDATEGVVRSTSPQAVATEATNHTARSSSPG